MVNVMTVQKNFCKKQHLLLFFVFYAKVMGNQWIRYEIQSF